MMVNGEARVLFSPKQLKEIIELYPEHQFIVQSYKDRAFSDAEYISEGIEVCDDVSYADLFLGIKQVPTSAMITGKSYFFFSHTIKKQLHNIQYLNDIQKKGITLYDYESFIDNKGFRVVAFGNMAGQLGAYHGLRAFGLKNKLFALSKPYQYQTIEELTAITKQQGLQNIKVVITGNGNVGKGCQSFLIECGFTKVSSEDFLKHNDSSPVFTSLEKADYLYNVEHKFHLNEFLENPSSYKSSFLKFTKKANLFMAGHYYHNDMPMLFTQEEIDDPSFNINTIADISCDVFAPIPTCLRPSTSKSPIYGYSKITHEECDFKDPNAIAIMAIDNLPSQLPKQSSIQFGKRFKETLLPLITRDRNNPTLKKGMVLKNGKFTERFKYLEAFLRENIN